MQISDMTGKVALITGAASGLGRATALKLAGAGANLCVVDRNQAGLDETLSLMPDQNAAHLAHATDLTDPDACRATVAACTDYFGQLDSLCNIAGIIKFSHSHQTPRSDWDTTIAINLSAPFFLSQAAIPHLLTAQGAIVNVASSAAFIGEAYVAAYCASKAGLVQMTKSMAMEYMHQPIRINAVAPGGMMTNIAADMQVPMDANFDLIKRYSGLRGLVEVDDVADMVAYLASPAGRGYHGACLSIDAGITAG
jgi:NAD(P)-dependent dehydrogenase (short-subunit alcohol dehydrogenase family)